MSNPVYNRLVFTGYMAYIKMLNGNIWTYRYVTALDILDLTKDPMKFPDAQEFGLLVANRERDHGRACMPWEVRDLEGRILWSATK